MQVAGAAQVAPRPRPGRMPLGRLGRKKAKGKEAARLVRAEPPPAPPAPPAPAPALVFHAQLAHGSATGRVQGFASIAELYAQIAAVFDLPPSEAGGVS